MELHYKKGGRRGEVRGGVVRIQKLEARHWKQKAGCKELEARSWMLESGGRKLEAGSWRPEAGGYLNQGGGPTNERMTGWMNQICPIVLYRNASPSEPLPKSTLMLASKANLAVQDTYEADWSIWLIFY